MSKRRQSPDHGPAEGGTQDVYLPRSDFHGRNCLPESTGALSISVLMMGRRTKTFHVPLS